MRVISKARLKQFWESPGHENAEGPLRAWYTHVNSKSVSWHSWGDVKVSFASASAVGDCIVFNIGGNNYRLIARVRYATQKVFVLKVMTHREYDGAGRDSYLELVTAFPLASIKSDEQLQEAQKVMDQLLARGKLDGGEEMYLDALSDLVAAYEDEHHAIGPASDADMLRHLMQAKGVNQAQISRETKIPKSTISEILAGKKRFSRQMIRKLAGYFGVDASVLATNF